MKEPKQMPTVEQSHVALQLIVGILMELGIPYHLDGGTLLGFYRDKDFCSDDHDDIDLTVSASQWDRSNEIIEKAKELGFHVYKEWPRNKERHYSGQLALKRENVKVDIMFKEIKGNKVWWTVYGGPKGVTYKTTPLMFSENLGSIMENNPFKQGYLIPEYTESYLSYRYGDWKIKVHRSDYSCYTTDRCIVKENTYEAI